MDYSPIALFVYNRPEHTKKTIEALQRSELAKDSRLFIFADGQKSSDDAKKVLEVRKIIEKISGFKDVKVIYSEHNKGLANSIISGISLIFDKFETVIVMEDDLIASNDFLEYTNLALQLYRKNQKIWSVCGYSIPIVIPKNYTETTYLSYRSSSWGWATWKDRWMKVNWNKISTELIYNKRIKKIFNRSGEDLFKMLVNQQEGIIDSWAIRFNFFQTLNNAMSVHPIKTKIINIGADGTGTNFKKSEDKYLNQIINEEQINLNINIEVNRNILKQIYKFYSGSFLKRSLKKLGIINILRKIRKYF